MCSKQIPKEILFIRHIIGTYNAMSSNILMLLVKKLKSVDKKI